MKYSETIKASLNASKLDEPSFTALADDNDATKWGFITLLIAGLASAIAAFDPRLMGMPDFLPVWIISLFFSPVIMVVGFIIGYSIYHFLAKFIFGGQATGAQYFRALSNLFVLYWFAFIPVIGVYIGYVIGFWLMILNVFVLKNVHKLSTMKAIILGIVLPLVVVGLLVLLMGAAFLAAMGA